MKLMDSDTITPNKKNATKIAESDSTFVPAKFSEQLIYGRAIEAVNWGMPIVNYDLMFQAGKKIGADFNQIVYWPGLLDWKNQTLTPNPDVIYMMPFFNTKDAGPVVLEIPPADDGVINGSVMDCWQTAIEDVGPAGVDKGKGGKYLILPPGYKEEIPKDHIPMPSGNWQGYALLRSISKSGSNADVDTAVGYAKQIRLYPLSQAGNPQTVFVDASDKLFDSTIPYDLRFFESLDRMVQYEPFLTRDKLMIDMLKTIGIEKGKPFNPDVHARKILNDAARDAHIWIDSRYDAVFIPPYFEGTHWALPASKEVAAGLQINFTNPDSYPVDGRAVTYSMAFFSAKHFGAGQSYLMTIKDKEDNSFDGKSTYRLHVSPHAPVKQYWSATVYDRATHAFIRNQSRLGRSSQSPGLIKNEDGSVDIYFGPKVPAGKEPHWVPTSADGQFEVLFRLYGPEKAYFDKTWKLGDIEKIK